MIVYKPFDLSQLIIGNAGFPVLPESPCQISVCIVCVLCRLPFQGCHADHPVKGVISIGNLPAVRINDLGHVSVNIIVVADLFPVSVYSAQKPSCRIIGILAFSRYIIHSGKPSHGIIAVGCIGKGVPGFFLYQTVKSVIVILCDSAVFILVFHDPPHFIIGIGGLVPHRICCSCKVSRFIIGIGGGSPVSVCHSRQISRPVIGIGNCRIFPGYSHDPVKGVISVGILLLPCQVFPGKPPFDIIGIGIPDSFRIYYGCQVRKAVVLIGGFCPARGNRFDQTASFIIAVDCFPTQRVGNACQVPVFIIAVGCSTGLVCSSFGIFGGGFYPGISQPFRQKLS